MNPVIIGVSGKKLAGKSTLCKYLHGHVFDVDIDFNIYSFADSLKRDICINLLGLTGVQCYGTDEQKESLTNYRWEDLAYDIRENNSSDWLEWGDPDDLHRMKVPRKGYMTARNVMEIVGTDIFRKMFGPNVWVNSTLNKISENKISENEWQIALIDDVRFVSEVDAILKTGGYVIRLTRKVTNDTHDSEVNLDNYDWKRDNVYVIDNSSLTMNEKNKIAQKYIEAILKESDVKSVC